MSYDIFSEENPPYQNFKIFTPEEIEKQKSSAGVIATYGGSKENQYGDSHITYVRVMIEGKEVLSQSNIKLNIKQRANTHSSFEMIVGADAFNEQNSYPLEHTRSFLGSYISFFFHQFGKIASSFMGIIESLSNKKIDGSHYIIIRGKSPTILLDNGLHCRSFENSTLQEIIEKVVKDYPKNLIDFSINPNFKDKIPYIVQYRQSDWTFLSQLMVRYGEYMYFNGSQIVVSPWGSQITELTEQEEIYDYELKMNVAPQHFSYTAYDSQKGDNVHSESKEQYLQGSENPFQQFAVNASEGIFNVIPSAQYNQSLLSHGGGELNQAVLRERQRRQNLVYVEAKSCNPDLKLCDIVKINAWMPGHETFKTGKVPVESYRLLELEHHFEDGEGYYNTFMGVPKDLAVAPYMDEDAYPKSEEQTAIVADNNDPLGINRIRVQFPWQVDENQLSPWIHLIQPHGGSGKGFHIIPEKGETVHIGFESNNMEKPYIIGAKYSGKEKSNFHTSENNLKVLKTRSGHSIILDDTQDKLSLTITDINGNIIYFDTMAKSIKIQAPETIEIIAKNLKIDIEEDIITNVGRDIRTILKRDYSLDTGRNSLIASNKNTYLSARTDLEITGGKKIIGYSKGITEWGAKKQMHVYGQNSRITALDAIEYKAPNMNKLIGKGAFSYTDKPEIIDATWVSIEDMETEITEFSLGEELGVVVQTRNYEAGEEISIDAVGLDGAEIQKGQTTVTLKGTVNEDGFALLTLQTEEEEETMQEGSDSAGSDNNDSDSVYKTYKGKDYTKEEWEVFEQEKFELYAKKNNIPLKEKETAKSQTNYPNSFLFD